MPLTLTRLPRRTQPAVYWAPVGKPGRDGKPRVAAPVEILCRWEDVTVRFIDAGTGDEVTSKARVFPNQEVVSGGWLLKGGLDDLAPDADPITNDAHEIRRYEDLPDFKGSKHLLTAML